MGTVRSPNDSDEQQLAVSPTSTTTTTTVCCVTHVDDNDDVGDAATVVSTNDGDDHLEPPSGECFPLSLSIPFMYSVPQINTSSPFLHFT